MVDIKVSRSCGSTRVAIATSSSKRLLKPHLDDSAHVAPIARGYTDQFHPTEAKARGRGAPTSSM